MSNADRYTRLRVRLRVPADSAIGQELEQRPQAQWQDIIQDWVTAAIETHASRAQSERQDQCIRELREQHEREMRDLHAQLSELKEAVTDLPARMFGALMTMQFDQVAARRTSELVASPPIPAQSLPKPSDPTAAPIAGSTTPISDKSSPRPELRAAANSLLGQLRGQRQRLDE